MRGSRSKHWVLSAMAWGMLGALVARADPPPGTYQPLPRTPTIIVGATVLDGRGQRLERSDVYVVDGRISAVGVSLPRPAGVTIIDGTGRWLTPGIIDPHTHAGTFVLPLAGTDSGATDISELSDPVQPDIWIEEAVRSTDPVFVRALAGGVTTMQILPGSGNVIGGHSVIVKPIPAVTVAGMKFPGAKPGFKMSCGSNPADTFAQRGGPNSRMGAVALMRRKFAEAEREMQGKGAPDDKRRHNRRGAKLEALADVMAGELLVHVHCYRADDMAAMIALAEEFGFKITAFHHATEAYKITKILNAHGACIAAWPDWWGFKTEAQDGIPENAAFIDASGGCVMMHSDIPVLGDKLNIEAAKAAASGRRAGIDIPPERAIMWITANPARTLGLGNVIGQVTVGYNADLVLWSTDPFSVRAHADLVMIDGAIAFDRARVDRQPTSDFELGRPQRAPSR